MSSIPREEVNQTSIKTPERSPGFAPKNRIKDRPFIELPDELWLTVLESSCTFPSDAFLEVMLNLIKNPNITSSHLFRADILYDSEHGNILCHDRHTAGSLAKHLKREYQPITYELPGFDLVRTIVRQLVPRNPQLDRPLVQTCHFFCKVVGGVEENVVVYSPHAQSIQEVPFYHPAVSRLAFEHIWQTSRSADSGASAKDALISISYFLFPGTSVTSKLERTALRLLQTVHKHGQGQLAGYEKRVHHDQVLPQKRYQDTYTRLKTKYGKQLADQWVEVTDPGKHVFEDIGIAAFLIELWNDMYYFPDHPDSSKFVQTDKDNDGLKPTFPGFVDIGCGNGILVYILLAEGYEGWGFDARERKSWRIFPESVQNRLTPKLLIPDIWTVCNAEVTKEVAHNGIFEPGTFIISNHADELTAWTPLLAYLNESAFVAIPCCSHDLAGARFRAPPSTKMRKQESARLLQQRDSSGMNGIESPHERKRPQAAETGSLKRTDAQKNMPSAYSTLCSYVTSLAEEVGFEPEREVLRIPSTRNQCIIGGHRRKGAPFDAAPDSDQRQRKVVSIVERELGATVDTVESEWIARVKKLAKKPGSGH